MSDVLEMRREERVLILTLNRPEKRNALNLQLSTELVRALTLADEDAGVGAVLIAANGSAFCAGMDLTEMGRVDLEELDRVQEALFTSAARVTKPIVAAVTGAALAGGTGLAANAHIVVAGRDAKFGLTEIRIGLWPMLVFRSVALAVGERRAVEMSLTGRVMPAEEARAIGLVSEVAEAPLERATQIAREISQMSTFILKNGLEYVRQSRGLASREAGEMARSMRETMLASPDFAEGIAAFREKRAPRWPNNKDY